MTYLLYADVYTRRNNACDEDSCCVNRATKIECADDPACGSACQNQRFQRRQYANISVIKTEKKGYGLRLDTDLQSNDFIIEYIGEVISESLFWERMIDYDKEGLKHFYFMFLSKGEFIDGTRKGNLGRFCNHSCTPNCYIEKWVVGNQLRIGIFAERNIMAGEELVINYNVNRYGADPQPCYCAESNCTGYIGGKTQTKRATKLSRATVDDGECVDKVEALPMDVEGVTNVMAASSRRRFNKRVYASTQRQAHLDRISNAAHALSAAIADAEDESDSDVSVYEGTLALASAKPTTRKAIQERLSLLEDFNVSRRDVLLEKRSRKLVGQQQRRVEKNNIINDIYAARLRKDERIQTPQFFRDQENNAVERTTFIEERTLLWKLKQEEESSRTRNQSDHLNQNMSQASQAQTASYHRLLSTEVAGRSVPRVCTTSLHSSQPVLAPSRLLRYDLLPPQSRASNVRVSNIGQTSSERMNKRQHPYKWPHLDHRLYY